ncbi:MAG: hypothetical protein MUF72_20395 [Elainella sp. Prado103]|jgi:hypothetical protein|nr:hypothetical protein [Elainella sp. Prado103]
MKIIDQVYHCQLPGQVFGVWRLQGHLRIFQPHPEVQTVIITDMGFKLGWSIPYVVDKLIDKIVSEFQLDPASVIWIEHYTTEFKQFTHPEFRQVTFEWHQGHATHLQWRTISPLTAQSLVSEDLLSV